MAKRTTTKKKEESELLAALRFVSAAQRETGAVNQTHCRLLDNAVTAYDGILACGVTLTDTVPATCPNTIQLIKALERANDLSAVSFDKDAITVKTNKFRATVPCVGTSDLLFIHPDAPTYPLDDRFKEAAEVAAIYTKENALTVVAASLLMRNGSLIGTNTRAIIEVWHGNATPPGLVIPKLFVDAITKIKKPITHFGYSESTFTVWFNDKSWIKTQLYMEPWPDVDRYLNLAETSSETVPAEMWEAIKTVSTFSEDGRIYFLNGYVCSHTSTAKGAEYKVKGIPDGHSYDFKMLLAVSPFVNSFDWNTSERMISFYGENIRGVIMKSTY